MHDHNAAIQPPDTRRNSIWTLIPSPTPRRSVPAIQPIASRQPDGHSRVTPAVLLGINTQHCTLIPMMQAPIAPPADLPPEWSNPVIAWIEYGLEAIMRSGRSLPRAARDLAILTMGMDATLEAVEHICGQGYQVSGTAALAAVASRVLAENFPQPDDPKMFERIAQSAAWMHVWQGQETALAVAIGQQVGQKIAGAVIAYSRSDGAAAIPSYEAPVREAHALWLRSIARGVWQPTPDGYLPGIEPGWARVRTFTSTPGMQGRQPVAWDSAVFEATRMVFQRMQTGGTGQFSPNQELALQWSLGSGTVTPAGAWFRRACDLALQARLDLAATARLFAVLGAALHDATVACWKTKYQYRVARPIQWMLSHSPNWRPLIETPAHPSYSSGHATISAAAATILATWFPAQAGVLRCEAEDAARSRVMAGVHWPMDAMVGLSQGRIAATATLSAIRLPGWIV